MPVTEHWIVFDWQPPEVMPEPDVLDLICVKAGYAEPVTDEHVGWEARVVHTHDSNATIQNKVRNVIGRGYRFTSRNREGMVTGSHVRSL